MIGKYEEWGDFKNVIPTLNEEIHSEIEVCLWLTVHIVARPFCAELIISASFLDFGAGDYGNEDTCRVDYAFS